MSYQAPPPNYGQPAYGGGGVPQNHPRATTALILGILAFLCCGIFTGIPAFIIGRRAEAEIYASGGQLGGAGMAKAGWILGLISIILSVLALIFWIVLFATGAFETTTTTTS